jgi:hypothetical protein
MSGEFESVMDVILDELSVTLPAVHTIRDLANEVVVSDLMVTVDRVRDWLAWAVAHA